MNVPKELAEYKLERAELAIALPADWKLNQESIQDERWYWPIRLLKALARLPIVNDTWLAWGHTMDNTRPFAENTELCAFILAERKARWKAVRSCVSIIPGQPGIIDNRQTGQALSRRMGPHHSSAINCHFQSAGRQWPLRPVSLYSGHSFGTFIRWAPIPIVEGKRYNHAFLGRRNHSRVPHMKYAGRPTHGARFQRTRNTSQYDLQ